LSLLTRGGIAEDKWGSKRGPKIGLLRNDRRQKSERGTRKVVQRKKGGEKLTQMWQDMESGGGPPG